jgi:hypothetical protein
MSWHARKWHHPVRFDCELVGFVLFMINSSTLSKPSTIEGIVGKSRHPLALPAPVARELRHPSGDFDSPSDYLTCYPMQTCNSKAHIAPHAAPVAVCLTGWKKKKTENLEQNTHG